MLIVDVDPFRTGSLFHPDAVYRINVDSDGDIQADASFSFVFSEPGDGGQTVTAYYATGSQARQAEPPATCSSSRRLSASTAPLSPSRSARLRMFAGVRSDPFFADAEGALHGFQWTGIDTFAGKNVLVHRAGGA